MNPIKCKLSELTLNLDMSGRVTPCNYNSMYLKDADGVPINLSSGTLEQAWSSDSKRKFHNTLDKGIRNPYCKNCWVNEQAGNESTRQKFNEILTDVEPLPYQPRILILKHGNKCNSACRSCNPHSSTLWYKDAYTLEDTTVPYKTWLQKFKTYETSYVDNPELEQTIKKWNAGIIFYDLYGGEPLLHRLTYSIIDTCISEQTAVEQTIQLHTNGSIYKPDLIEKLAKFKNATIGYSIDGIGAHNDYIRKGSRWNDVIRNLNRYHDDAKGCDTVKIPIRFCTMSQNVFYIPETFEFFASIGHMLYFTNRVTDKPDQNICYLPNEIKKAVREKLMSYTPSEYNASWIDQRDCTIRFLNTMPTDHDKKQDSFWNVCKRLDELRQESFENTMPEWYQVFAKHYT